METMAVAPRHDPFDRGFWKGKRVFLTGHTGFKGVWLTLWLHSMGAEIFGVSLPPETQPNAFTAMGIADICAQKMGDIRDGAWLSQEMRRFAPDIAIHMAAQALVRRSYADAVGTFTTNVMGTANFLEACRGSGARAALVVTSDKVYENHEWIYGYREEDRLGGHDPYSASKACAEIVTNSYRKSFFGDPSACAIASARAGNVFGGGDWSEDRLIPDAARAFSVGKTLAIRNPASLRPWQHVVESLSGYLTLCRAVFEDGPKHARAWNFGPHEGHVFSVRQVADAFVNAWGGGAGWEAVPSEKQLHEAGLLLLNSGIANRILQWKPRLRFEEAIQLTADWYKAAYQDNTGSGAMKALTLGQIAHFETL